MSQDTAISKSKAQDLIREYLFNDTETLAIIDSFYGNPAGTFIFDPTKDEKMSELFLDLNEDFHKYVKLSIMDILKQRFPLVKEKAEAFQYLQVKIGNAPTIKLHEWGPKYEGIPVAAEGLVIAMEEPETYTKSAKAICLSCTQGEVCHADPITNELPPPGTCRNRDCDMFEKMRKYHPAFMKTDYFRIIYIEEPREYAINNAPAIRKCELKGDDVEHTFIGQRKKVIGNFRSIHAPRKSTNKIIIQVISMVDIGTRVPILPTEEQLARFKKLQEKGELEDKIIKSFAPVIYGEKLAKTCAILGIIGGTRVDNLRGEINILLVGDPGTGKTKILEFIPAVMQQSSYVNGATASGPGITVGMETLPDRKKMLRAGPVPMNHGGGCSIDEMGQMEDDDTKYLLQCMESGRIRYTKGPFDVELLAETAIYGGANPKQYYYNTELGIMDNINLPAPIVTRCDLKCNMLDTANTVTDPAKIKHINMMRNPEYGITKFIKDNELFTTEDLIAYFNHVRVQKPIIDKAAEDLLEKFYLDLRGMEYDEKDLRIDVRMYEALYRTSTAIAKRELSPRVTVDHVNRAIELQKATLKTFGMDTDKEFHQLKVTDQTQDKKSAFQFTWRMLEKENPEGFVDETEFVTKLHEEQTKHYPTIQAAQNAFDYALTHHQITKTSGKGYKM